MKFADFVCVDAIQSELASRDKPSVIRELVSGLVKAGSVATTELEGIVGAIMKREELGSTGIGQGIAVPHTKHASVDRLVGTLGVSVQGLDFDSLDGERVHLFFLLISPPDRPGDHLRALESISRQLRNDQFCRALRQANSPADIQRLLEEADKKQFQS